MRTKNKLPVWEKISGYKIRVCEEASPGKWILDRQHMMKTGWGLSTVQQMVLQMAGNYKSMVVQRDNGSESPSTE
jgi:hypothetical protein